MDLWSDVLLTASAGTGKTHALVSRFLAALSDPREPGGTPAARVPGIVAITFTIAAAAEMRKRVQASVRATVRGWGPGSGARRAWTQTLDVLDGARITTIHALCASILREHPLEAREIAGVTPGFEVLDAGEASSLREEAFRRAVLRLQKEGGEGWESYLSLAVSLGTRDLAEMLRVLEGHRFSVSPESLGRAVGARDLVSSGGSKEARPSEPGDARASVARLWLEVRGEYVRIKREHGGLDFDDLEECALALMSDPLTGERVRAGIRHLLVDEFQDVSSRQLDLILLLRGADPPGRRALFSVGDPKQSIFAFRGARGALDRLRRARPGLREARLERTRRFRDPLASFVNHLSSTLLPPEAIGGVYAPILPAPPEGPSVAGGAATSTGVEVVWLEAPVRASSAGSREDVRASLERKFFDPSEGGPVPAEEGLEAHEARFLADRVAALLGERRWVRPWRPDDGEAPHPLGPGDIAVLLSYRRHEDEYVNALRARGLRVVSHPGTGFHDRSEVQDVLNLLAVLAREGDEVALYGLLRSPFFAFSDEEIAGWYLPHERPPGLVQVLGQQAEREPLSRAARAFERLERWRALREDLTPSDLLRTALDDVGAWGVFADDGRGGRALANVEKLLDRVRDLPASGVVGLSAIHRHLVELASLEEDEPEAGVEIARDAINLMTVHRSKGLEFPVVLVPGLQRQWPAPRGNLLVSPIGEVAIAGGEAGSDGEGGQAPGSAARGREGEAGEREAGGSSEGPAADRFERVQAEVARDAELEARRLLYVAVTRAREHLLLTCVERRNSSGAPRPPTREPWRRWVNAAFHLEEMADTEVRTPEGWQLQRRPLMGAVAPSAGADHGGPAPPLPPPPPPPGDARPTPGSPGLSTADIDRWLTGATGTEGPAATAVPTPIAARPSAPTGLLPPGELMRGGGRLTLTVTELRLLRRCEARWWAWKTSGRPELELEHEGEGDLDERTSEPSSTGGEVSPDPGHVDARRIGTLLHELMARGSPWNEEGARSEVQGLLGAEDERVEELTNAVAWAMQQDQGTPGGPPLREEPITLVWSEGCLRGRPDAVFLSGGTPLIEDYKFGRPEPMSAAELREEHGFQLHCYALGFRKGRRPVHARVLLPRSRSSATWELTPLDLDEAEKEVRWLLVRAGALIDGRSAPRPCGRADCPLCGAPSA